MARRLYLQDPIEIRSASYTTTTIMSGLLPQELIDHIIDHVDDRDGLKACSLVCRQWSARSRKHLFVEIDFTSVENLRRWCACIRPGPLGPSSLVENLVLSGFDSSSTSLSTSGLYPSTLFNAIFHLQSFSGLRVLMIWEWRMTTDCVSSMLHSFGCCLENVTRLTLGQIVIHPEILAMFISHFPRLDDLSISTIGLPRALGHARDPHREHRIGIVPTNTRGKFHASGIPACRVPKKIFEAITLLKPRFHKVTLTHINYDAWRDYWPLVEACGESLEELHILANGTGEWTHLDPRSHCVAHMSSRC